MTVSSGVPGKAEIVPVGRTMSEVLATIHSECFENAWDQASFDSLLSASGARALLCLVKGGEPAGMSVWQRSADEAEVLTICIRPRFRKSGFGGRLLARIVEQCRTADVNALHLEVAAGNRAAIALYLRAGFEECGRRQGYYALGGGIRDDALRFRLVL